MGNLENRHTIGEGYFCIVSLYENRESKELFAMKQLNGGAGGLDHIRPEFQINGGRKFLTTSNMELTQYESIFQALLDSFMNFTNLMLNPLRP